MFAVFEIIALKYFAGNSPNYDENTCDWQATCYQTVLRFEMSPTEIFSSICLSIMGNYDKSAAAQIPAVFRRLEHIDSRRVF